MQLRNLFQENIDLPFGCTISDEASRIAINALKKLEEIDKVIDTFDNIDGATFDSYEDLVDDLYRILGR